MSWRFVWLCIVDLLALVVFMSFVLFESVAIAVAGDDLTERTRWTRRKFESKRDLFRPPEFRK